ncbi:MAG: PEP-CTERM sorting domain-containing protein [Pseudomonadota bacterium]
MKNLSVLVVVAVLFFLSGNASADITHTYTPTPSDLRDLEHNKYYSWRIQIGDNTFLDGDIIKYASLTFNYIRNYDSNSHDLFVDLLNTPPVKNNNGWRRVYGTPTSLVDGQVLYHSDTDNGSVDSFDPSGYDGFYSLLHYDEDTMFILDPDNTGSYKAVPEGEDAPEGAVSFPVGGSNPATSDGINITYVFDSEDLSALNNFLYNDDKVLGIGFDPDCHYFNEGFVLTIKTGPLDSPNATVPEPATLILFGSGLVALAGIGRKHLKK